MELHKPWVRHLLRASKVHVVASLSFFAPLICPMPYNQYKTPEFKSDVETKPASQPASCARHHLNSNLLDCLTIHSIDLDLVAFVYAAVSNRLLYLLALSIVATGCGEWFFCLFQSTSTSQSSSVILLSAGYNYKSDHLVGRKLPLSLACYRYHCKQNELKTS